MTTWVSVESTNIDAVAWENNTLFVRFHGGRQYAYDSVPHDTYVALTTAPSVGKFLNSEVKGRYEFRMLEASLT